MKNRILALFVIAFISVVIPSVSASVTQYGNYTYVAVLHQSLNQVNESLFVSLVKDLGIKRTNVTASCSDMAITLLDNVTAVDFAILDCNPTDITFYYLGRGSSNVNLWLNDTLHTTHNNKTMVIANMSFQSNNTWAGWNTEGTLNFNANNGIFSANSTSSGIVSLWKNVSVACISDGTCGSIGAYAQVNTINDALAGQICGIQTYYDSSYTYKGFIMGAGYESSNNKYVIRAPDTVQCKSGGVCLGTGYIPNTYVNVKMYNNSATNVTAKYWGISSSEPSYNYTLGILASDISKYMAIGFHVGNANNPQCAFKNAIWYPTIYEPTIYQSKSSVSNIGNSSVPKLEISKCSAIYTNHMLTLKSFEEVNKTVLNSSIAMFIETSNYNKTITNVNDTTTICLDAPNTIFNTNISISYTGNGTGYSPRYYEIYNLELNSSNPQTINLYLLSQSVGDYALITFTDTYGNRIQDAIIKILRWYPSLGTYSIITAPKTSSNGDIVVDLELYSTYYQFIVEKYGVILDSKSRTLITGTEFQIKINPKNPTEYYDYYNKIAYSCSNTESVISCSISDASGTVNTYILSVNQLNALSVNQVCYNTASSSATTITCNVGNMTGNIYSYELSVQTSNNVNSLISLYKKQVELSGSNSILFGNCQNTANGQMCLEGVFVAMILTVILVMVGIYSPPSAIIMSVIGIGISKWEGLIAIDWAGIIGLAFASAMIIYRVRK